jgi:succinate dehydrogenase/fumarate reductase flavoprotein subunit
MSVLIVGNGIAGLAAAVELLERGTAVEIVTRLPLSATESVARRGGFDVDDEPERHAEELGNPSFLGVATEAHTIFERLVGLDVPFRDERVRSLKTKRARTAHVGSATAHHLGRRLAARLRQLGCVIREGLELIRLVLDDSSEVHGVILRDLRTGKLEALAANRVCLATGGYAGLFDEAHPARNHGAALGRVFRQGAALEISGTTSLELAWDRGGVSSSLPEVLFANGVTLVTANERIEIDPETTSFHELALRVGDGARLDLSLADASVLEEVAGATLDAISEHHRDDSVVTHTRPARSLGGLRVTDGEACGISGLFAVGGASSRFHREKSAAGTALLVDLWAARKLAEHLTTTEHSDVGELAPELVASTDQRLVDRARRARVADGEAPVFLRKELARLCRNGASEDELSSFTERLSNAKCPDAELPCSPSFSLLLELEDALLVARAVAFVNGRPGCVRCTEDGRLEREDAS